nr:hypothetical protein [Tanacetum cinerariifolium]
MVINSPCCYNKELASPKQTALGKDESNPLIVDSLLKTIWSSMHHVIPMKHWLFQGKWKLCMSAKRTAWNEFSSFMASAVICLATETPLFDTMLVQPQVDAKNEDDDEVSTAPTPPSPTPTTTPTSPTYDPLPPPQAPTSPPPQAPPALTSSPLQEQSIQPINTTKSSMNLLSPLMETCASLTQKVAHLEQDKVAQALEITKLKQRVKKLERKRRTKHSGLKRSVVASKPKTMQEAIEIATELMDKKVHTFTERETTSKRKLENTSRTTRNQQQQKQHSNKRQNTGRVYTAASGGKKQYGGSKPLCAKCNYHHDGPCAPKCHKCHKIGHSASDCRNVANTNNANNQRGTELGQKPTCYECRELALLCGRMFFEESDKIEKYVGGLPDMIHGSVVASKPKTMQEAIEIATELMDKKIRQKSGCHECGVQGHFRRECPKLKKNNNHGNQGGRNNAPARVYAVGRAGTDPDANVVTVIVCAEKIVRIPWGNETLIIHGDGSNRGNATRLSIISCTKTEKYVKKGFPIFLAHITTKEVEDKSEEK